MPTRGQNVGQTTSSSGTNEVATQRRMKWYIVNDIRSSTLSSHACNCFSNIVHGLCAHQAEQANVWINGRCAIVRARVFQPVHSGCIRTQAVYLLILKRATPAIYCHFMFTNPIFNLIICIIHCGAGKHGALAFMPGTCNSFMFENFIINKPHAAHIERSFAGNQALICIQWGFLLVRGGGQCWFVVLIRFYVTHIVQCIQKRCCVYDDQILINILNALGLFVRACCAEGKNYSTHLINLLGFYGIN